MSKVLGALQNCNQVLYGNILGNEKPDVFRNLVDSVLGSILVQGELKTSFEATERLVFVLRVLKVRNSKLFVAALEQDRLLGLDRGVQLGLLLGASFVVKIQLRVFGVVARCLFDGMSTNLSNNF